MWPKRRPKSRIPDRPEDILAHLQRVKAEVTEDAPTSIPPDLMADLEELELEVGANRLRLRRQKRQFWLIGLAFLGTNALWVGQFFAEELMQEARILERFDAVDLVHAKDSARSCIQASGSGPELITPYDIVSNGIAQALEDYGYGFCEPSGSVLNLLRVTRHPAHLAVAQPDAQRVVERLEAAAPLSAIRSLDGFHEVLLVSARREPFGPPMISTLRIADLDGFLETLGGAIDDPLRVALPSPVSGGAVTGVQFLRASLDLAGRPGAARSLWAAYLDRLRHPTGPDATVPMTIRLEPLHIEFLGNGAAAQRWVARGRADLALHTQFPGALRISGYLGQRVPGASWPLIDHLELQLLDMPQRIADRMKHLNAVYEYRKVRLPAPSNPSPGRASPVDHSPAGETRERRCITLTPRIYGHRLAAIDDLALRWRMARIHDRLRSVPRDRLLGVEAITLDSHAIGPGPASAQ